ncbi:MAG: LapA family protein [Pseudomonadota bacterium]
MNALIWFLRGILFVALLGLAIKNSNEVELRFFFDAAWQAPLSLVILISLACGVVLGLLALLPRLIRQRRAIAKLRRAARSSTNTEPPGDLPG